MAKSVKNVAALMALLITTTAHAQINHCIASDGTHIYTDQGCSAFNAIRATEPPDVRLSLPDEPAVAAFERPVHGCARELHELEERLYQAISSRDHNALATLFDWSGVSRHTADRVMPVLTQISRTPLHEVSIITEYDDLTYVSYPVALELEQSDISLPGSFRVTRFRIMESAGCWWMAP